ncbi:MAG: CstA-like transporter-associated (seleno)protein [Candidatus Binatia bacterium]
MGRYWGQLTSVLRVALREWAGDVEYERYVAGCRRRNERPLDRGRFFAGRLEERYGKPTRCC